MHSSIFSVFFFVLYNLFLSIKSSDTVAFSYVYDYISNVEVKAGTNEYAAVLNYIGKVESSAYTLTDEKELILVKLNAEKCNEFQIGKSALGIVIRKKGMVERMIVGSQVDNGLLNMLKGVVNLMSIDEMRRNRTESDVNGECSVRYESVNETLLIKVKEDCQRTTFHSSIPESTDSFSIYQDTKIKTHYRFGEQGGLIAVDNIETHFLESVLSDELSQTFRSTTSLLFVEVNHSTASFTSKNVDDLIMEKFGNKFKDVFLVSIPEVTKNEPIEDDEFLTKYKKIIATFEEGKRAEVTMKLMTLLRGVNNRSVLIKILKEKNVLEMIHDALVSCGTKICSQILVGELDRCLKEDTYEANRMLLMIQHVLFPSELMVHTIWERLTKVSEDVYDQALETLASLVQKLENVNHMNELVKAFVHYVKEKLVSCGDDQCLVVHLTAIRNTKLPQFYNSLESLLAKSGNHSQMVMTNVFGSIASLNFDETKKMEVRQSLLKVIKREVNFYRDPRLKSEAIFSLVRLESATGDVVSVLDILQDNDHHLNVFLIKKLRELINMGIVKDGDILLESRFFQRQKHLELTYKDSSNMLVNQLMSTPSLYSDIHFNLIGEDGGVIRNSMTDIFLVTTAYENHIFSLGSHITGLQSATGISGSDSDEVVEGSVQLILFGKEARPIKLFEGSSQLMSAIWYAPSTLQTVLSGTFFPIEIYKEIAFQNGIVLVLKYGGATYLDFAFRLNSNLWYKTADSLLSVSGQAFITMESHLKSLSKTYNLRQSLTLKSGLDFETHIDFSDTPMKNCLSVSRQLSQMNSTTMFKTLKKHSNTLREIEGSCYSLSRITDQICATF